jgi:hypothetical protein
VAPGTAKHWWRIWWICLMASPTYRPPNSSISPSKFPSHWKLGRTLRSFQHGSASMSWIQHPANNRRINQVALPQRSYIPHHRQNYFEQFIAENPITFARRPGGDGILLTEALSENFDCLVGRDDSMFANYTGPAISLRLEASFNSAINVQLI